MAKYKGKHEPGADILSKFTDSHKPGTDRNPKPDDKLLLEQLDEILAEFKTDRSAPEQTPKIVPEKPKDTYKPKSLDEMLAELDALLTDLPKETPEKSGDKSSDELFARLDVEGIDTLFQGETKAKPGKANIPKRTTVWRELGFLGIKIGAVAIFVILIFSFFYGFTRINEPGMTPKVNDGDAVMFYRLDKEYDIGDLLLLKYKGKLEVRRGVAKAGDKGDITDDGLIINGSAQIEPQIYQKTVRYKEGVTFPLTVGKGQVFVLGDQRKDATDSRIYGPVNVKDTLGAVISVIRSRQF